MVVKATACLRLADRRAGKGGAGAVRIKGRLLTGAVRIKERFLTGAGRIKDRFLTGAALLKTSGMPMPPGRVPTFRLRLHVAELAEVVEQALFVLGREGGLRVDVVGPAA